MSEVTSEGNDARRMAVQTSYQPDGPLRTTNMGSNRMSQGSNCRAAASAPMGLNPDHIQGAPDDLGNYDSHGRVDLSILEEHFFPRLPFCG